MALMINGTSDESGLGKVHGGELNEPARFAGEAMDDGDDSDWLDWSERDPPLSEEFKASGIGNEVGAVSHRMASIELVGSERAEGAPLVGIFDRVSHLPVGASHK